jgi:hypothetical protein
LPQHDAVVAARLSEHIRFNAITDWPQQLGTRAIQHYLGHRNIQHTSWYTKSAPNRFQNFWSD